MATDVAHPGGADNGPHRRRRTPPEIYADLPVGSVRAVLIAILVVTLILAVFFKPPARNAAAEDALQVIVVAMVAFLFGSRTPGSDTRGRPTSPQTPGGPATAVQPAPGPEDRR